MLRYSMRESTITLPYFVQVNSSGKKIGGACRQHACLRAEQDMLVNMSQSLSTPTVTPSMAELLGYVPGHATQVEHLWALLSFTLELPSQLPMQKLSAVSPMCLCGSCSEPVYLSSLSVK